MFKKENIFIIILILLLVASTIVVGLFVYKWQQTKEELAKQTEEIKEDSSYGYCGQLIESPISQINLSITASRGYIDVTNPRGTKIGASSIKGGESPTPWPIETGDMTYTLADPGGKDVPSTLTVIIHQRYIGDYLIEIVQYADALPTDTYTLELLVGGLEDESMILADNIPFGNFSKHLYILRSTEEGVIPIIPSVCGF